MWRWSSSLPDSFDLKYANGDVVVIRMQYPWKPLLCSHCLVFGHSDVQCPLKKLPMGVDGNPGKSQVEKGWQVVVA